MITQSKEPGISSVFMRRCIEMSTVGQPEEETASTESADSGARIAEASAESRTAREIERRFKQMLRQPLELAEEIGPADIVVAIPFYDESDTIVPVVHTVREGLEEFYPGQRSFIAAIGSPAGSECLDLLTGIPESEEIRHITFLLNDEKISGKGWAIRAAMEIARSVGADLAIIEADLKSIEREGETEGLSPDWVSLLLEPIRREKMDLVVSHFNRHYLESPISTQLVYPLLTAIYDCSIHDVLGGQWGISNKLLRTYLWESFLQQGGQAGDYGIDVWLATNAITNGAKICETKLGQKIPGPSGKLDLVLRHITETLFERIGADRDWWTQDATVAAMPLLHRLAIFGTRKNHHPGRTHINTQELLSKYKRGLSRFRDLYEAILPYDTFQQVETLTRARTKEFSFPAGLWTGIVYHFLLAFAFNTEFAKGDLINAFVPLFGGRLAGFTLETQALRTKLTSLGSREAEELVSIEAERKTEVLVEEFILQKQDFLTKWDVSEEALKPPVPKVTYREFIPGVHLAVPLEVMSPEGYPVSANAIYDMVFSRYKAEFEDFIYGKLGVPRDAGSQQIVHRVQDFMNQIEGEVDNALLPGDLSTIEGARQVVEAVFNYFHRGSAFALTPEMAYRILSRNPPSGLLTRLGYGGLPAILREYKPNDVLALAYWSEDQEYQEWVWELFSTQLLPEHFERSTLKPVVVDHEQFPSLVEMRECGGLCKLTGRVVVSNLRKHIGGEYPKLRHLTTIAKTIIEMERFGSIWQKWAGEGRGLGQRVINSLQGHWGREPLSAHNIFENEHQRIVVKRIKELARSIDETAGDDSTRKALAENLQKMADSYHLALTLPDGTFVPCSAWSWASYSAKGGGGIPTPLSLHVERDWSSHDFLTEYFKASGGREEIIDEQIVELMGQGRECEDLVPILLGTARETDAIIQMESVPPQQSPAGALTRYEGNPVLEPVEEHPWESKYVLNPGAIKLNGKVYIVYRAFGEDDISRLGLAVTEDGFNFIERLEKPIFEPMSVNEEKGCEDARLTQVGERIFMLYTAYSGSIAQIGMASIGVNDFLNYRWQAWRRHGMVFPGFANKDGILFSEQFNGKFAMLHRVDPHIWITFSSHLRCPWPRKEHKILAGSTYGLLWDGKKIGGGAQPIKTKYGWLLITHGVDHVRIYRLGMMLLDLMDPTVLIYRSPNTILEPTEKYELGEPGRDWVPNVVFTCGAVPREDGKEILDADDELLIYYGSADSVIGVATTRIGDLIPAEFLNDSS